MQVVLGKNDSQNHLAVRWLLERCDGFGGIKGYFRNKKGQRKQALIELDQLTHSELILLAHFSFTNTYQNANSTRKCNTRPKPQLLSLHRPSAAA